ncbi:hypothetical protein P7D77_11985 [Enterococcus avium]|uniref:hypothetical protein n=1 Tax=Enterococcus avium TaxID=33945 RepID=UPI00288EE5A5|nr:hypothetical protein [Enterococcus avium]MDT2398676.1 hypothetical protein [Enterococcus avium]
MRLVDYIQEGYNIVTSECLGRAIRQSHPATFVFTGGDFEKIPRGKLLVDSFYSYLPEIRDAMELQKAYAVEQFTNDFVGAEAGVRSMKLLEQSFKYLNNKQEPNLLEIKLKDTDSVPEVWYKGERLDNALVDISYHWRANDILNDDNGANDINIEYYSTLDGKYLDKKIIGHKRDA